MKEAKNRKVTNVFTRNMVSEEIIYGRRSFIRKSKHRMHPNNVIIEGRFGIVVLKATTTVSNFLTTCTVVDGS
jgi:hypothetical protein